MLLVRANVNSCCFFASNVTVHPRSIWWFSHFKPRVHFAKTMKEKAIHCTYINRFTTIAHTKHDESQKPYYIFAQLLPCVCVFSLHFMLCFLFFLLHSVVCFSLAIPYPSLEKLFVSPMLSYSHFTFIVVLFRTSWPGCTSFRELWFGFSYAIPIHILRWNSCTCSSCVCVCNVHCTHLLNSLYVYIYMQCM